VAVNEFTCPGGLGPKGEASIAWVMSTLAFKPIGHTIAACGRPQDRGPPVHTGGPLSSEPLALQDDQHISGILLVPLGEEIQRRQRPFQR
jgi:hypothetical protein